MPRYLALPLLHPHPNIMKKSILLLLGGILLFFAFFTPEPPIVNTADIQSFLQTQHRQQARQQVEEQIQFWSNRLEQQPNNGIYQQKLAGLKAQFFRLSGEVNELQQSDSLLVALSQRFPNDVSLWQALAQNAISGHQFAKADQYINEALAIGEKRYQSSLLKVDILLERGNQFEAMGILNALGSTYSFDYLTRQVKLLDQKGQLDEAIQWMEKAVTSAEAAGNTSLINWSLANLGDMYGHQGEIKKSYSTFLKALQHNPADLHALKGIAWIAFSHDKNPELSHKILTFLQSVHKIPEYDLLLADIASYQKNSDKAHFHTEQFLMTASQDKQGYLYTRPLTQLQLERGEISTDKYIEEEIQQRPHPLSYLLKAQYLQTIGQEKAAMALLHEKVLGKTEEPDALYHAGLICKENGEKRLARKLLRSAKDAAFELGPLVEADIKSALREL